MLPVSVRQVLQRHMAAKNIMRRRVIQSVKRRMQIIAVTGQRFKPHMAVKSILPIAHQNAKQLIPIIVVIEHQFQPRTVAKNIMRIVPPNAKKRTLIIVATGPRLLIFVR